MPNLMANDDWVKRDFFFSFRAHDEGIRRLSDKDEIALVQRRKSAQVHMITEENFKS